LIADDPACYHDALLLARAAEQYGVASDGITFESVNEALEPRDSNARLWPQAERAKFWHAVALHPYSPHGAATEAFALRDAGLSAVA